MDGKIKIGILGPTGTFSEEAALEYLKKDSISGEIIPYGTITDVFKAIKKDEVKEGVVPIENILYGHVIETLDNLYSNGVKIKRAIIIPIKHNLVALPETTEIKSIMSHSQAFGQCSEYLNEKYSEIEKIPKRSTAAAMEEIKEHNLKNVAAIGAWVGAEKYGLKIVEENIGNSKENYTMFVILSKEKPKIEGKARTSIAIVPSTDRPGLLKEILDAFAEQKINLEMIQSRPDTKGSYIFYMDLVGSSEDQNVKEAFDKIKNIFNKELGGVIKILGTYPYVSLSDPL